MSAAQAVAIESRPTLAACASLLQAAGLPTADLTEEMLGDFFFIGPSQAPEAVVGLELHGEHALLRSLAVAPAARGRGLARKLVAHAEQQAVARGVRTLYLLTTTAAPMFSHLGYAPAPRDTAPEAIRHTPQFSQLCAATAAFMSKALPLRPRNVLILCTGNSARSILAEVLLNERGGGRFRAFSAGSFPKGAVHPLALELLRAEGLPTDGLRSKSWDEFAGPGSPRIDIVLTVCDNAAGETCPVWPGQPVTAHWGIPDPAAAEGTDAERREAFRRAQQSLEARIQRLLALPIDSLDAGQLKTALREIGRSTP